MPRRQNSACADNAWTTSVTIFFNAHVYPNYAHTISSRTESRPHCLLPSLLLATSSHHQHASRNQTCTYARTPAHDRLTYHSTQMPQLHTMTSKAALHDHRGRHHHHVTTTVSGSGGKNVIFSNHPYDQSKYSDPLIYVPI